MNGGNDQAVESLIEVIDQARTPEEIHATVMQYGPTLADRPEVLETVAARSVELRRSGREAAANRIEEWHREVTRRISEQRVMDALLLADSEDEREQILAAHPDILTEGGISDALREADTLVRSASPHAAMLVARLLNVAVTMSSLMDAPELLAQALLQRSRSFTVDGDNAAALADLMRAVELFRQIGDVFGTGKALSIAGSQLLEMGREAEALSVLSDSLGPLNEVGELSLLAPTQEEIGGIMLRQGDREASVRSFETAAEHRLAAGQPERALPLLQGAIAYRISQDDSDGALASVERLLEAAEGLPDDVEVDPDVIDLIRRAGVGAVASATPESDFLARGVYTRYLDEDRRAAAERWLSAARRAHALAPDEEGAAFLALAEAEANVIAGKPEQAMDSAQEVLRWFEGNGHEVGASAARGIIMQAASLGGDRDAAGRPVDYALGSVSASLDEQATVLTSQGQNLLRSGDPRGALNAQRRALALYQQSTKAHARWGEAATQTALANIYADLGDPEAAVSAYAESSRIASAIGQQRGVASCLHGMGLVLGRAIKGEFGSMSAEQVARIMEHVPEPPVRAAGPKAMRLAAADLLERAVAAFHAINNEAGEVKALTDLSNMIPDDSLDWRANLLEDVIVRKRRLGDRLGEAVALANLGVTYKALGNNAEAINALEASLAISRKGGFTMSAAASATSLGELLEESGDVGEAERWYAEAVDRIDSVRVNVPRRDLYLTGFAKRQGSAYRRLVDVLLARNADQDAFAIVQRAKSRAMLDLLGTTPLKPVAPPEGRFRELLEQEAGALAKLRAGEDVDLDLDGLYEEMDPFDPDYVAMRRGTPATVAGLRQWLKEQPRPVLLVEYFLTERNLTLFALRAEWPHVKTCVHQCTPGQLWEAYADFHREVVQYRNAGGQQWTAIARLLVEPLRPWLKDGDTVCLVPHGPLHAMPIHALPLDGSNSLIINHPVVVAPTAGLFAVAHNAGKGTGRVDSCAAFGVVFAEEADAVAGVFGSESVDAAGLTPGRVQELCRGKDVCHFSCHGIFDELDPLSSGLVLTETEGDDSLHASADAVVMRARDVMSMEFHNELLCLSACETAVSEVAGGDELIGLIRAFLYAGAPSIVASLWKVDAETTRDFMVTFYRALRAQPSDRRDKAAALQAAQLEIMRTAGPRASYRWAPFILIGDSR